MGTETGSKTQSHFGSVWRSILRAPGRLLGRLRAVLGPKLATKIDQKSIPKSMIFSTEFRSPFWSDFGSFWVAKKYQNGTKLATKRHPKSEIQKYEKNSPRCSGSLIFQVFGSSFGSQNRTKIDTKSETASDSDFSWVFLQFWTILGANLGPKRLQKATQNRPKNRWKIEGLKSPSWSASWDQKS